MAKVAHGWDLTPAEAVAVQRDLRQQIEAGDRFGVVRHVAGIDIGFERSGTITRAAVCVLSIADLSVVDFALVTMPTRFPYVPGLLSFREAPAALAALARLTVSPDVLIYDGHGLAHPRRCGVASHVGLLADIPSIGVAKSRLVGTHDDVPDRKGAWCPLSDHGEIVGAVLRTRVGVQPVYVSVGHRVGLDSALALAMRCTTRYRLPQTTRWAHRIASDADGFAVAERACAARQPAGGVK